MGSGGVAPPKLYNFDKDYVIKSIDFLLVFVEKSTKKSQIFLSKGRVIKTILKNENFSTNKRGGVINKGVFIRQCSVLGFAHNS